MAGRVVGHCRTLAATAASPSAATGLADWVRSNGGSVEGVAVESGTYGLALKTQGAVSAGAQLVVLPQACHLTYQTTGASAADPRLLALIEQVPPELWAARLALPLLAERLVGESSPYAAYISRLPAAIPGLPMFFGQEAVSALQYPPLSEQVKRRCRWLLSFSQTTLGGVRGTAADPFDGTVLDANALGWALGAVSSRAFRTRGPKQPASLLPLIDMANHSFEPNAKVAPAGASGAIALVALRDLASGEEVLLSYGDLPNDFLLLDYGFIVPNNPHDTVQLRFSPGLVDAAKAVGGVASAGDSAADGAAPPLLHWQAKALAALGLGGAPGTDPTVNIRWAAMPGGAPVDPRLLGATRVLCASNAGQVAGKSAEALCAWDGAAPLPVAAEAAALRTLTGLAAFSLAQFPGSIADDDALLAAAAAPASPSAAAKGFGKAAAAAPAPVVLSPDVALAVRFRLEKKRLLVAAMQELSRRLRELPT